MPIYQAIVLAIIQGLTEFLPISSTAHLALFPWLLGWKDPGLTFDLALHAGTLVAVLIYFGRTWARLAVAAANFGDPDDPTTRQDRKLFWYLVIGTIPAAAAGWRFEQAAEEQLRAPVVIGAALILVGIAMWVVDRADTHSRQLHQFNLVDALVVGVAQAVAIIPGVSRSGITMTAGLLRGADRETAARFSFLLSAPVIAGAALKKGLEIYQVGMPAELRLPFLVGIVAAGLVGYLVIALLMRFLARHTFKIFVIYRILLGVIVLLLGWGLRHASPSIG